MVGQEKIDRSMSRVAFVFPYRTLKMMLVAQSLIFIIYFEIPITISIIPRSIFI